MEDSYIIVKSKNNPVLLIFGLVANCQKETTILLHRWIIKLIIDGMNRPHGILAIPIKLLVAIVLLFALAAYQCVESQNYYHQLGDLCLAAFLTYGYVRQSQLCRIVTIAICCFYIIIGITYLFWPAATSIDFGQPQFRIRHLIESITAVLFGIYLMWVMNDKSIREWFHDRRRNS